MKKKGLKVTEDEITENVLSFASPGIENDRPTNWFRLGYLIHDVSRMRRTLYDQRLKPLGITRSQWWVLANIARNPEKGVVSSVLARDLDIGKVTLGGLIERLEAAGYVYRRSDKRDKRAKRVYISKSGNILINQMRQVIEPLNIRLCEGLSIEEIQSLEHGLKQVKANLAGMIEAET